MSHRLNVLRFAVLVLLVAAILAATPARAQNAAPRPNFVIFMADDLGWNDVQYHGSTIRTPNIDSLARTGVELNNFYVYPTCSPTRAGLITGRAPSRWGILGPIAGGDRSSIPHEQETLPEVLGRGGYQTALIGKWHLGILPADLPNEHGFDYSYGALHGQVDPLTHHYKYGDQSWHRNGEFLQEEGHATDLIGADAIRWFNEERDPQRPFFMYVSFTVPHYPLHEDQEWMAPYLSQMEPHGREPYEASVTHMDAVIGRVVAELKAKGQFENTVFAFFSDNGGQDLWMAPDREYEGRFEPTHRLGDNAPLRDWKASVYEGAVRVPAAIAWPGRFAPGRVDGRTRVEDILPTFARLAGVTLDEAMNYEGMDLTPVLAGEAPAPERTVYIHHLRDYAIIHEGWKLILPGGLNSRNAELYNLNDDPNETKDLAGFHRDRVGELRALIEAEAAKDAGTTTGSSDIRGDRGN